jgi:DNA-binding XRE family transcriptional regulator
LIYIVCNSLGGKLNSFSVEENEDPLTVYAKAVDIPVSRLRRWGIRTLPQGYKVPPLTLKEQPADELEKVLQSVELKWYDMHREHQELLRRMAFLAAQLTSLRRLIGYSRGRLAKAAGVSFEVIRAAEDGWMKPEHTPEALRLIKYYRERLGSA